MTEQQKHRARIVQKAIESIEAKLETGAVKPALADLVRLLQVQKELNAEQLPEARPRCVESDTRAASTKA
jgi:hypothetical protein